MYMHLNPHTWRVHTAEFSSRSPFLAQALSAFNFKLRALRPWSHIRAVRGELAPPPDELVTEDTSKPAKTGKRRLEPVLDRQLVVGGRGKPIFGIGATRVTVPPAVGLSSRPSPSLPPRLDVVDGEGGASAAAVWRGNVVLGG